MKLEVRKHGSEDRIVIDARSIAIKPPPDSEYILEATVDEGDSPMMILTANGHGSMPLAVKHLRLTRTSVSRVKRHTRVWPRKPSTVNEHDRRKPVNLKSYARWKSNIAQSQKAYWDNMTPEERRAENQRRRDVAARRKSGTGLTH